MSLLKQIKEGSQDQRQRMFLESVLLTERMGNSMESHSVREEKQGTWVRKLG